jgi:PAS domain S-box-containing protein
MKDHEKTREQLISELAELRGRVAACHESEARVRCLFETVPLGVTECDTGSVITLVNPAFANMTGYSSKELVGMRVADLVQEGPQREAFLEYLKYLVLEQPTPSPYRCTDVTKDGRVIDVQVDWTY